MCHLMAEFPGAEFRSILRTRGLDDAVFWLAEVIEYALGEQVQSERKPSHPIRQNAVADIAAAGEVAGKG